jgi:cytochrome c oxidase subunit II
LGDTPNVLAPESHPARDIASLFWWMMGGAWLGLALVVALLFLSWKWRNRRAGDGGEKAGEKGAWYVVIGLGIVTPIALITTLFFISDLFVLQTTDAPAAGSTRLTIRVIGHQWWWEVRYPGTRAVTANEIHIPVRTKVRLVVETADVIHSFWVPQLNRKIDTIPEQPNSIELEADHVGVYRGACAEFCGLQHAHMAILVFADPPDVFRRWLANESKPAAAAAGRGHDVFMNGPCASCHAIRGTRAGGYVGPDLTHVASRKTLGSITIPNDAGNLAAWIVDSQHFKPGNQMPNVKLSSSDMQALVSYLESLK